MAPRRPRNGSRRAGLVVATAAVVAVAVGLALAFGGPSGTAPTSTAGTGSNPTAPLGDLSLVPVLATATPVFSPAATGSTTGSLAPAPTSSGPAVAGNGLRAERIRIPRLSIDLRIIEGDGIDAPIGKAAHYPSSAWPGAGSNVYIYGHAREGMFIDLWEAREGDLVELDLVDGTTRAYVVKQVLPKVAWDAVEYLRPTATEQLTLQTSTSYQPTAPRFIVIAHPVS